MPAPASLSEQVLALPSGPGGVHGLGETFAADPYTGTGRYRIPVPTPAGHGGLKPELALVYSSGAGNGVCGVGWAVSAGAIRRRTEKGIPQYRDDDRFVLGDDELVPRGSGAYSLRSEGSFSRIRHVRDGRDDFWAVTDRSGVRRLYGRTSSARDGDATRITAWNLSEIRDPNNNVVSFTYARDAAGCRTYLTQVDWGDGAYRLLLDYAPRPDVMRTARAGFAQATSQRLARLRIQVRRTSSGLYAEFDRLDLSYDASPITGLSRLRSVTRTGTHEDDSTATWPSVGFTYAEPLIGGTPTALTGHPGPSLASPDHTLVDLDGDGLPDVLQSTDPGWLLWRNRGDGSFARPVPVRGPNATLRDVGVFLSDLSGEGFADLVTPDGFYKNDGSGFGIFRRFVARPSFDLEDAYARFLDLDGDGVGDVLVASGSALYTFLVTPGVGFGPAQRRTLPDGGLPSFADPRTRLADIDGDGLQDLVRLSRGAVEVWQNQGHGTFGTMRRIPLPENLPADVEPEHMTLADVTGTGAADLVVRRAREIWVFPNGCGAAFGPRLTIRYPGLRGEATIEAVDLLGTGVRGLLLTDVGTWTFYELFASTKPDILQAVDNGMGGTTAIRYGSSVRHAVRDRLAGRAWSFPLPYAVQVVAQVATTDAVTGMTVTQRFAYHEGYHDAKEREFRGFAWVDQWDAEADVSGTATVVPSRTVRFFDVGNGRRLVSHYFPVPTALPEDVVANHDGARRALRGMLVREEIYGEDGTGQARIPYAVTHHAYTVTRVVGPPSSGDGSFFAARTATLAAHTERGGDPRILRTATTYDALGRVTEAREQADGRRGTFATDHETQQAEALERLTRTTYLTLADLEGDDYDADYVPSYLVDRPAEIARYGVVDSVETLIARDRLYYDGDDYEGLGYPGSATDPGVTRGRLSSRLTLAFTDDLFDATFDGGWGAADARDDRGNFLNVDDEWYLHAERSKYDPDRGMRIGAKDPNGNEALITYDGDHGLFVTGFANAADHPTTLERSDFPFQVTASIDPNGNRTEFTWDPRGLPATKSVMGRYVGGAWQGDPPIDPTEQYTYDFTSIPVAVTVQTRQVRAGATFDVVRYLDGVGRTVQERHTAEPDPDTADPRFRVTGWQVYNEKGLVVRVYQPTFADSDDYSPGSTETASVATTYDPLGRPVRVDYPDGTFETTTYHPWVREAADRNDNADGLSDEDPRYGDFLDWFSDSVATPTRVYSDGFGREIAVAENMGGGTFHVTRTVLDLKDQAIEIWDARGLAAATWTFTYDLAGRRLSANHPTALGLRYAFADAAGNPIWARDAKNVEVDRTFDVLNRPVTESSDDGTTTKLRRAWQYHPYDDGDGDFADWQAKNVFGRVEEERDADGVRFFEYDWRGLVTLASHRFWPQADGSGNAWDDAGTDLWTTGSDWDPAVDDTERDSVVTWLDLPGLDDTTTIEIATTYDAAGRPLVTTWPKMQVRRTYNEAGLLAAVELNRDGGGYSEVVGDFRYDARGKPIRQTFGSTVVSEREWDADIERLTRIYTYLPGGTPVEFQDLRYDYDPVGNPLQITDALTTSTYKSNNIIPNTRTFRYDPRNRLVRATGKKHATVTRYGEPDVPSPDPGDYDPYDYDYEYDEVGNLTLNDEFGGGTLEYKATRIDLFNGDSTEAVSSDPAAGNYTYDDNGNALHTPRLEELAYTHDNQVRYVDTSSAEVRDFRHADQRAVRMVKKGAVRALGIYLGPFEYQYRGTTSGVTYSKVVLRTDGFQAEVVATGSDPDSVDIFYVHADHLGSGHVLTDASGTLLSQEEYFPYGKASDRRYARNRYRYIGVERDEETGLCMTGPRTYDPYIARFLQGDPEVGGAAYVYSRGNPVSRRDGNGYADTPPPTEATAPGIPASAVQLNPTTLPGTLDPGSLGVSWNNAMKAQPDTTRESAMRIYEVKGKADLVAGADIHKGDPNRVGGSEASVTWSTDDLEHSRESTAGREGVDVGQLRDRGGYHNHADDTKETLRWSNAADIDSLLAPPNANEGRVEALQAKTDGYTEVAIFQPHPNVPGRLRLPDGPSLTGPELAGVMERVSPGRGAVYGGMPGEVMQRIAPDTSTLSPRYLARLDRQVARARP